MSDHAAIFREAGIPEPSPSSRTLGFELLDMDPRAGTARVRFEGRPEFANPTGYVQGGFLAAMLDDVIGMMGFIKAGTGNVAATIDFHMHCLRPVRVGPVEVAARISNRGPSVMFAEATLYDSRGKEAAKATSALAITAVRQKTPDQQKTQDQ